MRCECGRPCLPLSVVVSCCCCRCRCCLLFPASVALFSLGGRINLVAAALNFNVESKVEMLSPDALSPTSSYRREKREGGTIPPYSSESGGMTARVAVGDELKLPVKRVKMLKRTHKSVTPVLSFTAYPDVHAPYAAQTGPRHLFPKFTTRKRPINHSITADLLPPKCECLFPSE